MDTGEDKTRYLMLGLPGAGKTTLLTSISKGNRAVHDMGNQKFKMRSLQTDDYNIVAWDVGAEKYVDAYWADYHAERASGVIFVVDSSAPDKIAEARAQLFVALGAEKLANMPLLVMANKGEVEGALSTVKVSELLELHEMKTRPFKVFRTSATSGEGIDAAIEWISTPKSPRG